jgi:hypothetical protein
VFCHRITITQQKEVIPEKNLTSNEQQQQQQQQTTTTTKGNLPTERRESCCVLQFDEMSLSSETTSKTTIQEKA